MGVALVATLAVATPSAATSPRVGSVAPVAAGADPSEGASQQPDPQPEQQVDQHRQVRTRDGRLLSVPAAVPAGAALPPTVTVTPEPPVRGSAREAPRVARVVDNGAWTLYSSPRALTTPKATYIGSVTNRGDIQVTRISADHARLDHATLAWRYLDDDHAAPALLRATEGRIAAFWGGHGDRPVTYRVSSTPESVTTFGASRRLTGSGIESMGVTYTQLLTLPGESRRYWLLTRGSDQRWYLTTSADLRTWTKAVPLFDAPRGQAYWPYLKAVAAGRGTVDFAVTDGAPNQPQARGNLFHIRYTAGRFVRSDGRRIATLAQVRAGRTLDPREGTLIYNGSSPEGRARVYDIARGPGGRVAVAMTTQRPSGGRNLFSHKWFRLSSGSWKASTLTRDVAASPQGFDLAHGEPSRAWVSPAGRVQEWRTTDHGATWTSRPVSTSGQQNRSPVIPWSSAPPDQGPAGGDITGLFLRGPRQGWRDGQWDLDVMLETTGAAPVTLTREVSPVRRGVWNLHGHVRQGWKGPVAAGARVRISVKHPGRGGFVTVKELATGSDGRYAGWVRSSPGAVARVTVIPDAGWGKASVRDVTLR